MEPRSLEAFSFDSAVARFGDALTAELDGVEEKTKKAAERKRTRIFEKWVPESKASGSKRKFREPDVSKKG